MTKKKDIPHLTEWTVVREEFSGHWRMTGENHLFGAQPLMEVTRMHTIDGIPHVVSVLEWGDSVRFHTSNVDAHMLLQQHRFTLETLWRAQAEATRVLPKPHCRPTVNIFEEADKQKQ